MGPFSPLPGRSSWADKFCCGKGELLLSQSSLVILLLLSVLLGQHFNEWGGWEVGPIIKQNYSDECGICMAEIQGCARIRHLPTCARCREDSHSAENFSKKLFLRVSWHCLRQLSLSWCWIYCNTGADHVHLYCLVNKPGKKTTGFYHLLLSSGTVWYLKLSTCWSGWNRIWSHNKSCHL